MELAYAAAGPGACHSDEAKGGVHGGGQREYGGDMGGRSHLDDEMNHKEGRLLPHVCVGRPQQRDGERFGELPEGEEWREELGVA